MALAVAAGAAILGGSIYASTPSSEVKEDTSSFLETRKKGILQSNLRAPQAITGAPNIYAPYYAPTQSATTLTEVQDAYTQNMTETQLQQAKLNLKPRGGRLLQGSSGQQVMLVMMAGSGDKLGDVKGSESLATNPIVWRRANLAAPPSVREGDGIYSGVTQFDDSSKVYPTFINKAGVTFNDKRNPYSRGGEYVNLNTEIQNGFSSRNLPQKGNLVSTTTRAGTKAMSINMG